MDPGLAPTPQLITPPLDANSFEVGGVLYTATADISITRFKILQRKEAEFGFDNSLKGLWDATTQIKEVIDQRKGVSEIAYLNESMRRGLTNLDRNRLYQLQVIALWYNAPDENPITYDQEAMTAKMQRWEDAGLGVGFLFARAAAGVRSFRELYLASLQEQVSPSDEQ